MATLEIAGLTVHLRRTSTSPHSLVILLHGYGAPGTDLVSIADEVAAPPGITFLFPEGPVDLTGQHPEMAGARAWWPIDVMQVQLALMTGRLSQLADHLRPGLAQASERVSDLVEAASQHFGLSFDRIVLGGFSQGAIVSLEATTTSQWNLGGMLLFSGSMLDRASLSELAPKLAPLPCVLSHGQVDPVLPFSLAEELRNELCTAGWAVDWVPFLGGHGIPPSVLSAAGRLITRQLA